MIIVSIAGLLLGIFNLVFSIINRRKDLKNKFKSDFIESDSLLDKAFNNLHGPSGFSITRNKESFTEAGSLIKKAKKLTPKYSRVFELEGLCFEIEGRFKLAEKLYLEGIQHKPQRWQLYNNLGLLNFNQGEYDVAISYLEKSIEIDPQNAGLPLYNIGRVFNKIGDVERAQIYFVKSLDVFPNSYQVLFELGKLCYKKGEVTVARRHIEKSISYNPSYLDSQVYLGYLLAENGEWENGLSWINHAYKLDPNDGYPMAMIAALYADKGMYKEALEYRQKTIAIDPKFNFEGRSLNELYSEMKELERCNSDKV
jgi:tetratricopeptide (TPR) repeat protein